MGRSQRRALCTLAGVATAFLMARTAHAQQKETKAGPVAAGVPDQGIPGSTDPPAGARGASPATDTREREGLRLGATVGLHSLQETYHTSALGDLTDGTSNLLLGLSLGVRLGKHFIPDLGLRTTAGIKTPFRALSLGVSILSKGSAAASLRAGVGAVQGFQGVVCAPELRCPDYIAEWKVGLDVSGGVELRAGGRWFAGPTVWWVQSFSDFPRYRSIGGGLLVGWRRSPGKVAF